MSELFYHYSRDWGRHELGADRAPHRDVPMPHWLGPGHCRWCNGSVYRVRKFDPPVNGHREMVVLNRRRRWHRRCYALYEIASIAGAARNAVYARDRGTCADCGERREWEVDHFIPLFSVDRGEPLAIRFWLLGNLETRCLDCHKAKSARESRQRAAEREAAARSLAAIADLFAGGADA